MEYGKNLTEILKIRISKSDLDFYKKYAADHEVCVSEAIRHILIDYRIYCEGVKKEKSKKVASTNKRH